jgi:DNA replication protein DnaC
MSSHLNNIDNFSALRLSDARSEYQRQIADVTSESLGFIERVDLILTAEMTMRYNRRVARRIREAGLRTVAYKEEFSFESDRGITRSAFANLVSLAWASSTHSVLISGATGAGKTYLACVIATEAARREMTVRYHRTSDLIEKLALARADGSHRNVVNLYRKVDLLVLDDFGLSPISISASRELLEILDERVDVAPTVIASQFPPDTFHQLIEDATAADAILDRIIHDAIVVTLTGESMRKLRLRHNQGGQR